MTEGRRGDEKTSLKNKSDKKGGKKSEEEKRREIQI